jgi:hypothetical protein
LRIDNLSGDFAFNVEVRPVSLLPRLDSLFLEKNSLIRVWKFPVPLRREFGWKPLNSLTDRTSKSQRRAGFSKIPC